MAAYQKTELQLTVYTLGKRGKFTYYFHVYKPAHPAVGRWALYKQKAKTGCLEPCNLAEIKRHGLLKTYQSIWDKEKVV